MQLCKHAFLFALINVYSFEMKIKTMNLVGLIFTITIQYLKNKHLNSKVYFNIKN